MEWLRIDDNTPLDTDILVRGGKMVGEIPYVNEDYTVAHVKREGHDEWNVQNTCYYVVRVHNPLEYCLI